MHLFDEELAAFIATVVAIVVGTLAVIDTMVHGVLAASMHLGMFLGAVVAVRFTVCRSLNYRRTAPQPATED